MRPTDPRLLAQLRPARRPLTVVLTGSVGSGLLVVAQAFAISGFLVAAVRGDDLAWPGTAVALVLGGRALLGLITDLAAARAAADVGTDLRRRVVDAVLEGPTAPGPAPASGELAALGTRGVAAAEPYLTRYLPALVLAGVLPPLIVVAIATQDLLSAVIVLATLPLVPVFGALVGLATRDRAERQWRAMASLAGHFVDVVKGAPTLVAYRRARAQSATIGAVTDRYRRATLRTLRIAFASSAVLELVATLSVALVAVVVGVRLADGQLDLRTGLVVLLLAPEAYWPLRRVGAEFHAAAEGVATFERIAELTVDSDDGGYAAAGPVRLGALSVTYPGRTVPALASVTASIPDRGLTAIVGPSGCGKSTLLATLMGMLPPTSGTISVGGHPVRGEAWRSLVGWVPQRPTFVDGTVADNLRLAAPEADDGRLWDALDRVRLGAKVRSLPDGLDAPVGEDARALSAGERARLALARVVLADRPWVLLDEPTAHLDDATERDVLDAVRELSHTRGVVVVAHRPAFADAADQVIHLQAPPVTEPERVVAAPPPTAAVLAGIGTAVTDKKPARFGSATLLGAAASASGVALTATAGWLIVKAAEQPAVLTLLVAIVGVRAFGLARPALRYAERLLGHDAALRLLARRRVEVYDALVPLTPGGLGSRRGDLLASIVDDVDSVVDRRLRVRMPVHEFLLVAVLALAVAAYLLPVAALVLASTLLLGTGVAALLVTAGTTGPERRSVTARADLSSAVVEVAQTAPELVMWQARSRAVAGVLGVDAGLRRAALQAARSTAVGRALVTAAAGVSIIATGVVATSAAAAGDLSGPMLALLVLLPLALAEVATRVVDAAALTERVRSASRRLADLESHAPVVSTPEKPRSLPTGPLELAGRGLAAAWDGRPVLRDVDLDVRAGERLAVVGPSGSGKSTLAALLLRFVDPVAGQVTLGDLPLPELALDDVRRKVGLVDDDPHVFATTLAENIRLARPGASDAELIDVLHRARLGRWLSDLPDGLGTWLGDGHAAVSGGERARLGVARALLADLPVLVLDEPTAHLDTATAEQVAADVLDAADGRSVVWITHSPVGLDRMDRVLSLGPWTPD
jgi:ATP-binding cassette subfamily C protein CydCD